MGPVHPSRMYIFLLFFLLSFLGCVLLYSGGQEGAGDRGCLTITAQAGSRSEMGIPRKPAVVL